MSMKANLNVPFTLSLSAAMFIASAVAAQKVPENNEQPLPAIEPAGPALKPATPPVHGGAPVAPPTPVDPNAPVHVKISPMELDLGEIPTMDSKTGKFTITNTDSVPRTVKAVRASCGCTALKFVPDTVIPAGESIDVEVQLSGGATEAPIAHKTVTVIVEGQPDQVMQLKGMAVSYVKVSPDTIDANVGQESTFKLVSKDGQAFRIMSMQPPAVDGVFPTEAKAEHEVTVTWDHYITFGANRRVSFYLDHPKCQMTNGTINLSQELLAKVPNQPTPMPTPPPVAAPVDENIIVQNFIKEGKNAEVLEKIKGGLDVNHRDQSGMSLLSHAARAGNVELMSALLASGADKEMPNNAGLTPLMFAAQSKKPAAVALLLDAGASIEARGSVGGTALSWASGLGDAESVQLLIDAGAQVEIVDGVTGWTPLIWASGFGDPKSIPVLVKAGANLEAADLIQGATPLINAARTGKVESIKELVKAGAKIENRDRLGKTALLAAAENSGGTYDKVQALIAAGADIHAKDNLKRNALQLARKRTDIRAPEVLQVLEPLLAAETPPDEPAHADATATPAVAGPAPAPAPAPATNGKTGHEGHNHD